MPMRLSRPIEKCAVLSEKFHQISHDIIQRTFKWPITSQNLDRFSYSSPDLRNISTIYKMIVLRQPANHKGSAPLWGFDVAHLLLWSISLHNAAIRFYQLRKNLTWLEVIYNTTMQLFFCNFVIDFSLQVDMLLDVFLHSTNDSM